MTTWIRGLVGILCLAFALYWAWRAVLELLDRQLARGLDPVGYPNEWGVRIAPLDEAETRQAIATEDDLAS